MTITHPAPRPALTLEQRRDAYWESKSRNRRSEDGLLFDGWLHFQTDPATRGQSLLTYLTVMTDGYDASPGSLYNAIDRERARRSGYAGNLTELALWGRAMREGWNGERIARTEATGLRAFLKLWLGLQITDAHAVDDAPDAEVPDALLGAGLTPEEVRKARVEALEAALRVQGREAKASLTTERGKARELLARLDPQAPKGQEADTLALQALQIVARTDPQALQSAVKVAQAGNVAPDSEQGRAFLDESRKPLRRVDWGKQHAHDFVTGALPKDGQIFDAHHLPLGESEARTVGVQVLVFVYRPSHIPQPGGPVTAHSRTFSTRSAEVATYALRYQAIQDARWEAHVRWEPDPYPAHLSVYLTLPGMATFSDFETP